MRREEPRTGRVADKEFQFWECWEFDANVPEAPPLRHWFRSDTGMEAQTYDHMLQKLYRRSLGLPENQPPAVPSATNEWDRRIPQTLRVNGEDVLIEIIEHYREENGSAPVSVKVRGPNGLLTSSYQEMLEKLGLVPAQPSAISSQSSAEPPAVAGGAFVFDVDVAVGDDDVPESGASLTTAPATPAETSSTPTPKARPTPTSTSTTKAPPATAGGSALGDASSLRDARNREEMQRRVKAFKEQHPWVWDEGPDVEVDEPFNSMRLVWWGEYIKAVYPELAAAALDPEKYDEYMENYDPARPVPIPTAEEEEDEDEDAEPVAAEAPRCQFIKCDGETCGSPALKNRRLCYFHSKTAGGRKRRKNGDGDSRPAASTGLEMPVLEDDLAIQMAVTNICRQLANETIDPKRATSLLYGIQVASVAVRRAMQNRRISSS